MVGIFQACVLTVLIETPFLSFWGYRRPRELALIVCTNVFTNLLLSLCLFTVLPRSPLWILAAEAAIVWGEAAIYARALGSSGRLYLLTFLANCLSFGIGLLLT